MSDQGSPNQIPMANKTTETKQVHGDGVPTGNHLHHGFDLYDLNDIDPNRPDGRQDPTVESIRM